MLWCPGGQCDYASLIKGARHPRWILVICKLVQSLLHADTEIHFKCIYFFKLNFKLLPSSKIRVIPPFCVFAFVKHSLHFVLTKNCKLKIVSYILIC